MASLHGECSICCRDLALFGQSCVTQCGHAFHTSCVKYWLEVFLVVTKTNQTGNVFAVHFKSTLYMYIKINVKFKLTLETPTLSYMQHGSKYGRSTPRLRVTKQ